MPQGTGLSMLGSMSHMTDARITERISELIDDPDRWANDATED
ncbi:hypothetical protein [Leucobacter aridicollis]|nr:hypothetical protein [Leucobacter aridicollis]